MDEPLPKRTPVLLATSSVKENYENLAPIIQPINESIRDVTKHGVMIVGERISFEFFLGGDYKFLLCVTGMNASNAKFACIYCDCPNKTNIAILPIFICWDQGRTQGGGAHWARAPLSVSEAPSWAPKAPPKMPSQGAEGALVPYLAHDTAHNRRNAALRK